MRLWPWRRTWPGLVLFAACGLLVVPASAGSNTSRIKTLKAKRAVTVQKRKQAETRLREVKKQQRTAQSAFNLSEERLGTAQRELRTARVKMAAAERRIKDTKAELARINDRLDEHIDKLWKRLEVFYKEGAVAYVDVVVGATDFDQFVDRTTFLRTIAEDDIGLKQQIEAERRQEEALKADLDQTWRQLSSLRQQCAQKAEVVRQETLRRKSLLDKARHDRSTQEDVYAALVDDQRDLERMLYRLQNPPRPRIRIPGRGGRSSGGSYTPRRLSGGFIKPCSGRYSSGFGWRIHPITGRRKLHDGLDIAAPSGTTIVAAAAGTVVFSGSMRAWGNNILIDHGSGYVTRYAHCSSLLVNEGQQVSQGQPIGRVGSTGYSTGPHLHFSVYVNGVAVSPLSVD